MSHIDVIMEGKQNMTLIRFTLVNIILLTSLFVVFDPSFRFLNNGAFADYEQYFEPIFLLSLGIFVSSLFIFCNKDLFATWLKKFFVWYFPLALLLTFASPTSSYTMPHRYDVAVMFGALMVVVTVGILFRSLYLQRSK